VDQGECSIAAKKRKSEYLQAKGTTKSREDKGALYWVGQREIAKGNCSARAQEGERGGKNEPPEPSRGRADR